MSYHRKQLHEGEVKKCPSCLQDKMRFVIATNSWICAWCANSKREDFFQRPLPTDRELELDEIQPDSVQRDSPFYFKSIGKHESDYEDSVNSTLSEDEIKYHGSAQSALEQDNARFASERERLRRVRYMQTRGYYSDIIGNDSTEVELDRHRVRRMKERDDKSN